MANNLGNKETMAKNIRYYMDLNNVTSKEMCTILKVPTSTFSYWLNAKTYPRIDKIEKMARYFQITKSDLVEERSALPELPGLSVEEKRLIRLYRKADSIDRGTIWSILSRYDEEGSLSQTSTG